MVNGRQLISNVLLNDRFSPTRLAGKRRGGSDESRGVKVEANSFEVALFSLWFNSINFRLPGVCVITDVEKAEDPNTGAADADKPGIGTVDLEEVDGAEADGAEADGAKADRVNKLGIGIADPAEADGADEPGTGTADPAEADGADEPGTGTGDGANKPDTGLVAEDPRRRPAERQAVARASLFSFCRVACFFFFSSESETSGFSAISRPLSSVITFVKRETPSSK